MSTIDFDKFDLDGLSLEKMEAEEPKSNKLPEPDNTIERPESDDISVNEEVETERAIELEVEESHAKSTDDQMTCPKCELLQLKAEQCSGCGIYVEKALAQIGKSNIQITATKF